MKKLLDCEECVRLWREYSVATAEHIRLDNKLGIAALSHAEETVSHLAPAVEAAVVRRSHARDAIRRHEGELHPPSAETVEA